MNNRTQKAKTRSEVSGGGRNRVQNRRRCEIVRVDAENNIVVDFS